MYLDKDKIAAAFRGDGGLAWAQHHPCLFEGTEWFFRTGYRAYLPTEWLPALGGVDDKLPCGAKVADVGCRARGASVVVMAQAYPNSRIWGFDVHAAIDRHCQSSGRQCRRRGAGVVPRRSAPRVTRVAST